MKNLLKLGFLGVTFYFASVTQALATTIYAYTGNNFTLYPSPYTDQMSVSATFSLAQPLAANLNFSSVSPISFSLSDGVNTITDQSDNLLSTLFRFITDGSGNIQEWNVSVLTDFPTQSVGETRITIGTVNNPSLGQIYDQGLISTCTNTGNCSSGLVQTNAFISGSPGAWQVTTVPVPAAAWLFGSGLLGLIGVARRKKAA
jgi:hypothetical protein